MIDEKITFKQINIAVITLSDTRKESDDKSGNKLKELIQKKGHSVSHYQIIEDEPKLFIPIIQKLTASVEHDVIITSGGTGLTGRDNTIDALKKISQVEIPGFGESIKIGITTTQKTSVTLKILDKNQNMLGESLSCTPTADFKCEILWTLPKEIVPGTYTINVNDSVITVEKTFEIN